MNSKTCTALYQGHKDFIKKIVFIPCANNPTLSSVFFITASADSTLRRWPLFVPASSSPSEISNATHPVKGDPTVLNLSHSVTLYKGHKRGVMDACVTADGKHLFSASSDTTIRQWDVLTGACLAILGEGGVESGVGVGGGKHLTSVLGLCLSRDGEALYSVSADKTARRWDFTARYDDDDDERGVEANGSERPQRLSPSHIMSDMVFEHEDFVTCVCLVEEGVTGRSGVKLVTGCRDMHIRVWDVATGECEKVYQGHTDQVSGVSVRNGTLYSSSLDGTIRRWDLSQPPPSLVLSDEEAHANVGGKTNDSLTGRQESMLTEEEERELAELAEL